MIIIRRLARCHLIRPSAAVPSRQYRSERNATRPNPFRRPNDSMVMAEPKILPSTVSSDFDQYDKELEYHQNLEIDWQAEMDELIREEEDSSPLQPIDDAASIDAAPGLMPTHNIAAYVKQSSTLQEMIKLGMDLSKIEKRRASMEYVLKLDFDRDMREHIRFFTQSIGISPDRLGWMFTKNPHIFAEDLDNLETRCNYLLSKRFHAQQIVRIVDKNPFWLMFSTKRIDHRLGYFQREYQLTGDEVRTVATMKPTVITSKFDRLRDVTFMMREEFNMDKNDFKRLLLKAPAILIRSE